MAGYVSIMFKLMSSDMPGAMSHLTYNIHVFARAYVYLLALMVCLCARIHPCVRTCMSAHVHVCTVLALIVENAGPHS